MAIVRRHDRPGPGLPTDHIGADLDPDTRGGYTSPTNIGGLLWDPSPTCSRATRSGRWFCTDEVEAVLRPVIAARTMPVT